MATIDISQLKSGAEKQTPAPKNIDGKEIRDFGNGLKEFDPAANGFKPEEKELIPTDKDRALDEFDKMMDSRIAEVQKYNELLDQYGGAISEEDLRKEMGQSFVTDLLQDGTGGKFEENPGNNATPNETNTTDNQQQNITADDVANQQSSELDELEKELEEDEMDNATYVQNTTEQQPAINNIMEEKVDTPVQEVKQEPVKPEIVEKPVENNKEITPKTDKSDMSDEDKDLAALEDDGSVEPPTDDFDEQIKAELSKKMRVVSKKFDLSNAVISKTPVTVSNALGHVVSLDKRVFTWALFRTKQPITMKAFTATELNVLQSYMRDENRHAREIFKSIYDHIVSSNKGKDFDTWAKCTSYFDVNHIWFAVYGACFNSANYLPYTCSECKKVTIANDIPLMDMCKFSKPEFKNELENIKKSPYSPKMGNVFAEYLVQISDEFVFGFKEPTIYDAVIEPNLYDAEFRNKYGDIISVCSYISNIYSAGINQNGQVELRPIACKEFVGNESKTAKARIIQYAKIIRSLTSDEYNMIMGHITTMTDKADELTYRLPTITCDHCKKEIGEEDTSAADLVFMRHRLAILGV